MQTLKSFGEQFKIQPYSSLTQMGNVFNISYETLTKQTFHLLNKNVIPTPSISNKNQLNKELDGCFILIKLEAYFKDNNMYNTTTKDQLFKPKANKK